MSQNKSGQPYPNDFLSTSFLPGLSRFCFVLGFAHLATVVPLLELTETIFNKESVINYITIPLCVGALFLALSYLCRIPSRRLFIANFSLFFLFLELCYANFQFKEVDRPSVLFFGVLSFLVTPIRGKTTAYYTAALSCAVIAFHYFTIQRGALNFTSPKFLSLFLLCLGILLCAFLSEWLWNAVMDREFKLQTTLRELRAKANQMDAWAHQLAEAGSTLDNGQLNLAIATSPPFESFQKLTRNIGEMQNKLKTYFGSLVIKDRLNSLGGLASGLAHEINTPLTTLAFLLDRPDSNINPKIRAELMAEITRMSGITREFLNYSSSHQESAEIDLNEVIRTSLPILKRIDPRPIDIKLELCSHPLVIDAVKNQIEQVIVNIYKNAVDAMTLQPHPRFIIATLIDGKYATFSLTDNGVGIDSSVLPRVLEPFFSTKTPGKGVGLGLFVVHEILERQRGQLKIQSDKGNGTTFTIQFPLKDSDILRKSA